MQLKPGCNSGEFQPREVSAALECPIWSEKKTQSVSPLRTMANKAEADEAIPSRRGHAGMPKGRTHIRWEMLFLISLMYLITYLDRVSISNAAPLLVREFGFSPAKLGIVFSAFVWAYALFQVPGGWLGDHFGPRKTLTLIMGYRALIALLTTRATSLGSLWGIRFALGMGEAGAFPTATRAMQT